MSEMSRQFYIGALDPVALLPLRLGIVRVEFF